MTESGIIIKGVAGSYTVAGDFGFIECTPRGIFRNRNITPLPGDYVHIDITDTEKKIGVLHTILPRKNELNRPKVANTDQVIITMAAANPVFDRGILDRFLIIAAYADIEPVICINKWDLKKESDDFSMYRDAGYTMLYTSCKNGTGMDELKNIMRNKTSVLAGPSGVGKSSIINYLLGNTSREIGELSTKINRGKHTTRHTELIPLQPTGYCADTPGFSSLETDSIPIHAFAACYKEFAPYIGLCKFSDCLHDKEKDCAVKEQVGRSIHAMRYESYLYFIRNR